MEVRFPNLRSRLLLGSLFERQFIVPRQPPRLQRMFMRMCENIFFRAIPESIAVDRPILLIGLHRSGTTVLQDILCSHPHVGYVTNVMNTFPDSLCTIEQIRKKLGLDASGERFLSDGVEVSGGSPNEGVVFWERWLKEDPIDWRPVEREMSDFAPADLKHIYESIQRILWTFGPPVKRFFSKNPRVLPYVKLLAKMFPDARFVHIVRDPRMCANSMVKFYRLCQRQLETIRARGRHGVYDKHPFMPYPRLAGLESYVNEYGAESIQTAASLWNEGVTLLRSCRDELPSFFEVRYEDLLAAPLEEVERIRAFCELEPISDRSSRYFTKVAKIERRKPGTEYANLERIESICRENMQHFGYL